MSKKIELEYELKTRSGSAVWALISTPIGLMKWLADEVTINGRCGNLYLGVTRYVNTIHIQQQLSNGKKQLYTFSLGLV